MSNNHQSTLGRNTCRICGKKIAKEAIAQHSCYRGHDLAAEAYCMACQAWHALADFPIKDGKPRSECRKAFNARILAHYHKARANIITRTDLEQARLAYDAHANRGPIWRDDYDNRRMPTCCNFREAE